MRRWLDAKMTRMKQRFERRHASRGDEFSHLPSSKSFRDQSTSTSNHPHRSKSEPRKTENGKKVAPETMRSARSLSSNNPDNATYLSFMIAHKKNVYIGRHLLSELDEIDLANVKPCKLCNIRYSTIQCDPCTHDPICKYCAYNLLSLHAFPDQVFCPMCGTRLTGFTKKDSGVRGDENERNDRRHSNEPSEERSMSFYVYASALLKSSNRFEVNQAFESSGTFSGSF